MGRIRRGAAVKIVLTDTIDLADTMVFERQYEEPLRLSLAEKTAMRDSGWFAVWMFIDGALAGETYGARLSVLDEKIEDCAEEPMSAIYCYSTTLLPSFRGKGLAELLKAFWLGMTYPATIVGHATSPAAWRLNEKFGAAEVCRHAGWYGTEREAVFYRLVRR